MGALAREDLEGVGSGSGGAALQVWDQGAPCPEKEGPKGVVEIPQGWSWENKPLILLSSCPAPTAPIPPRPLTDQTQLEVRGQRACVIPTGQPSWHKAGEHGFWDRHPEEEGVAFQGVGGVRQRGRGLGDLLPLCSEQLLLVFWGL